MERLIEKNNFKAIQPIISNPGGIKKEFLQKSLINFFDEMDFYIEQNKDYGFWKYQHERTLLSMYLNGVVRNDIKREISLLQEYGVWDDSKVSQGRCDAFLNFKKNAILIEAKRDFDNIQIKDGHWDIDAWLDWDYKKIGKQLENYYLVQKNNIVKDDYDSCQLMTLVFNLVKINPDKHSEGSRQNLENRIRDNFSRDWFYTFLYDNEIDSNTGLNSGLEIYGTLKKIKI